MVLEDDMYGEMSWEMAESKLVRETFIRVANKDGKTAKDIDLCLSGDLLNQVSASTFGVRDLNIPYLGVYGACSTMGETMGLGAMLIDGGFARNIIAGASSHFCAAEKQYRAPLGMGNQRPPTTTWTVTGDGAVVLSCFEKNRSSRNNGSAYGRNNGPWNKGHKQYGCKQWRLPPHSF